VRILRPFRRSDDDNSPASDDSLGVIGMAWSRTYLQVHWLTDVIAGALLGSGISLLVFAIAQRARTRAAAEVGASI